MENKEIRANNLTRCREEAGLSISRLAKLSGMSVPTINDIANCKREGLEATKHRIVYGLNQSDHKVKEFTFKEVFPFSKKGNKK